MFRQHSNIYKQKNTYPVRMKTMHKRDNNWYEFKGDIYRYYNVVVFDGIAFVYDAQNTRVCEFDVISRNKSFALDSEVVLLLQDIFEHDEHVSVVIEDGFLICTSDTNRCHVRLYPYINEEYKDIDKYDEIVFQCIYEYHGGTTLGSTKDKYIRKSYTNITLHHR